MNITTFSIGEISKCNSGSGIYAIRGTYNNFNLVGQTTRKMLSRWKEHIKMALKNKHENPHFQKSFNKHGIEKFDFVVLEELVDLSKLNERESFWIKQLDSMNGNHGWNMREGGAYGNYGPELRRRVSEGIRKSKKATAARESYRKTYTLRSPMGELVTFTGLRKFCRENGMGQTGGIYRMMKGEVSHVLGWTLPKKTQPLVKLKTNN